MKFISTSTLILIYSLYSHAQESDSIQSRLLPDRIPDEIGTGGGIRFLELGIIANAYRGDLTTKYEKWTQAFHIGVKLSRKKRLNGHVGLTIGKINGENINYVSPLPAPPIPNKFFTTNFIIFNYDLLVNIIRKELFVLYLGQGIGVMRFTPRDKENNDLASNSGTRAKEESKEYRNVSFVFPQIIGAVYSFKNEFGVGLQIGLLNQATDYVDNISVLSNQKIRDNILRYKFSFYVPINF